MSHCELALAAAVQVRHVPHPDSVLPLCDEAALPLDATRRTEGRSAPSGRRIPTPCRAREPPRVDIGAPTAAVACLEASSDADFEITGHVGPLVFPSRHAVPRPSCSTMISGFRPRSQNNTRGPQPRGGHLLEAPGLD